MHAYDVAGWQDFFVGTIGASAGLLGLLFVTISINLQEILKYPHLPGRAAGTLGILLAALLVSGVGLAPGQSAVVLGVEVLVIGAVVLFQALWVTRWEARSLCAETLDPRAPPHRLPARGCASGGRHQLDGRRGRGSLLADGRDLAGLCGGLDQRMGALGRDPSLARARALVPRVSRATRGLAQVDRDGV